MKKILLFAILLIAASQLKAQNIEFSVLANGGMSHFTGGGTQSVTFLNADPTTHSGYANGTGNSFAFSYGAGAQLQFVAKCGFLFGAQAGYDAFSNKNNINGVFG